jgi:hypothetical protein
MNREVELRNVQEKINNLTIAGISPGLLSDGYHTFSELYDHRVKLWIALCCLYKALDLGKVWRSKKHSDGAVWEGWFLLGIETTPGEQMTYHLPESEWEATGFAETLEIPSLFDGHGPKEVLERLQKLTKEVEQDFLWDDDDQLDDLLTKV